MRPIPIKTHGLTVHRHELPQEGAGRDAGKVHDGGADAGGGPGVHKDAPALFVYVWGFGSVSSDLIDDGDRGQHRDKSY